ncbi:MAG: lytic transglycosylase domain-containing protein [Synergistales bacterium]
MSLSNGFQETGLSRVQARIEQIRGRFAFREAEAKGADFEAALEASRVQGSPEGLPGAPALPPGLGHNVDERLEALQGLIASAANRHGVDGNLVRAVIRMESGGNPRAVSEAGAMGLMQLMPSTARMLNVEDPFDPAQNVNGGVRYLRGLLDRYGGDESLALAAYHSGPSRVDRYGGIPPFPIVNRYVKAVRALARREPENGDG